MKELIVQLGGVQETRETEYFDIIAFKGEYYKGQKEVYLHHGCDYGYIDGCYFDDEIIIESEQNFGSFSSDHYDQLTHEIILLADHLKNIGRNITFELIENLVNTYKNENNL